MFSIMTIASSTTNPVAIVIAISDKLLRLNPARYITASVPTKDSGTDRLGIDRKSTRLNSSHSSISYAVFCLKKKIATLPALGETDILRVVQMLPGVVARNDFSAGYNVRGGEADQNLILLDVVPIYNPFHLAV